MKVEAESDNARRVTSEMSLPVWRAVWWGSQRLAGKTGSDSRGGGWKRSGERRTTFPGRSFHSMLKLLTAESGRSWKHFLPGVCRLAVCHPLDLSIFSVFCEVNSKHKIIKLD